MAWAARIARPLAMAPESAIGPSNHSRSSWTRAKGERLPGMAAGAGRDRDQAVGALLDRLAGEAVVDHVVQHDAAPAMHRVRSRPRARPAR